MTAPIYTYGAMLRASAAVHGNNDALVFPDRRLSHAELYAAARDWAKALIAMGVKPGQNVGLLLTTRPEFVELMFGIAMVGAVVVPVNARYQAHELAFLVRDADLVLLFTTGKVADQLNFSERLLSAFPQLASGGAASLQLDAAPMLHRIICLDQPCPPFMISRETALAVAADVPDSQIDAAIDTVDPQDIALILYTSGTTANPKGALISHRAIIGNSRNLGVRYQITPQDKVWSPLPIFHIAGILPLTMVIDAGGTYLTVPHFDAGTALAMLDREGATVAYPSFVTIMQDLITHPSFAATDLSKLRLMNSNFAVQPAWIKESMTKAMPHTVQVGTYGLTEGAGTVCTSRIDDSFALRTERLGVPLDEWEVRIVDIESGRDCAIGERGEIVTRGPNMLRGYYKAPEKTAEALRDGWFYSGDIGSFDESGHIMFHGRTKDMLKVGGENVAAAEIEALLQSHPAVKLAQVIGLPDSRYVEVPAAFIELVDGAAASESELIAHCRGKLSNFKIPRHIRFIKEWPMSTSKIQKYKLRHDLVEDLGLEELA
jgi:fatty-acyl-CoA synthase